MSDTILKTSLPQTLTLSLNRPDKRNALNIEMLETLCTLLEESTSSTKRVLILKGEGKAFCAGLDLKENFNKEMQDKSAKLMAKVLDLLYASPLITICLAHGAAIAGGAGLMTACDFSLIDPNTKVGYPEVRLGLVAGLVMTFLQRRLQERHVKELVLLGELIDGQRAYDIGLVNAVVPKETQIEHAFIWVEKILKGAPQATKLSKRLLDELHPFSISHESKTESCIQFQGRYYPILALLFVL